MVVAGLIKGNSILFYIVPHAYLTFLCAAIFFFFLHVPRGWTREITLCNSRNYGFRDKGTQASLAYIDALYRSDRGETSWNYFANLNAIFIVKSVTPFLRDCPDFSTCCLQSHLLPRIISTCRSRDILKEIINNRVSYFRNLFEV